MLNLKNVTVTYENEDNPAVKDLNFSVERGEFVCVLGRSGAGKSTFIRTINGLQPLQNGTVTVLGHEISSMHEKKLREIRSRIGMIFQHFHLIPRMSVKQNVFTGRFGQRRALHNFLGIFSEEEKENADYYLKEVGLYEFRDRRVERLSGGQKQRVGIARAMVQNPSILLGDEPVASLDPTTSDHIFYLLRQLHEEKNLLTIINVHDIALAEKYASRIIGLKNGELVFDGRPADMTARDLDNIYE
ncbi:phosphonate ABC transporter ATP-binding protein [Alkalicoccus halolimnae]|uniref:Phosphonate ABC transporter ATP-binding protein n=1 Tax=Alkalicoccus halolimnae TaxID=1667239 RepID=A0A5C7FGJ7_9BACI|nr:phosphonate ABC transporter ATP-binding protein [Alkalicoccus halolimnae]TXF82520.1 phosphonate ABC transporter ATP-binding protein [Alkalicoccus halolimnae]